MLPPNLKRILVVKLSALGDVIHATGPLRVLRRQYPNAFIAFVTEKPHAAILEKNPHISDLFLCDNTHSRRISVLQEELENHFVEPFDLSIDLHGNQRSSPWIYASRASIMAGIARGPRLGWQYVFPHNYYVHALEEVQLFFQTLGINDNDYSPELFLETPRRIEEDYIVLNPFSSFECKCWPLDRFATLAHKLQADYSYSLVLTGSPAEAPRLLPFLNQFPSKKVINLVGKLTLKESIGIWKHAKLMVSGDSGPLHAGAALGTKVLALFGPTLPQRSAPWGQRQSIIQEEIPPHFHYEKIDKEGLYIRSISVEKVYNAVSTLIP